MILFCSFVFFRGTLLVSPTPCLLDAYTCNVLNHGVKTCGDIDSRCRLVQLVDLIHLMFPIFLSIGPGLLFLLVVPSVYGDHRCCLLTMTDRNP